MKDKINLKGLKDWFRSQLNDQLESSEIEPIFNRLLAHHELKPLDIVLGNDVDLDMALWENYVGELKNDKPIQYILGYEWFCDLQFMVNKHVLIPRPETEELVNWICAEEIPKRKKMKILDIGTGSGCIAIALKIKMPWAEVWASDVSRDALEVAKSNAQKLSADIFFVHDDILNTKIAEDYFDIIVSNPPYIPMEEADEISERVKNFEPTEALFTAEKKPLQFYEAICFFAKESLSVGGSLFFEMHEDYAQEVKSLAESYQYNAVLQNDMYGKPRMICIKKDEQ